MESQKSSITARNQITIHRHARRKSDQIPLKENYKPLSMQTSAHRLKNAASIVNKPSILLKNPSERSQSNGRCGRIILEVSSKINYQSKAVSYIKNEQNPTGIRVFLRKKSVDLGMEFRYEFGLLKNEKKVLESGPDIQVEGSTKFITRLTEVEDKLEAFYRKNKNSLV